jgi:ATP-dependent DNA ligase
VFRSCFARMPGEDDGKEFYQSRMCRRRCGAWAARATANAGRSASAGRASSGMEGVGVADREDDASFVAGSTASAYLLQAMKINPLPVGFVVPAQPVKASKPPVGTDWVHEIKHDGYRLIVRRDGPTVRLYSRNAMTGPCDWWRSRLLRIKAKSFTVGGEAVVLGPDGCHFEKVVPS